MAVGTQAQLAAQGHWTRTEAQRTAYPTNYTSGDSSTIYVVFRKDRIYSREQRQAIFSASPRFQFMKPGYSRNTILKMPENEYMRLRTLLQQTESRHKLYEAAFMFVIFRAEGCEGKEVCGVQDSMWCARQSRCVERCVFTFADLRCGGTLCSETQQVRK